MIMLSYDEAYFRWIGIRLEMLGNFIVLLATIFALISDELNGAQVGLSISYAVQVMYLTLYETNQTHTYMQISLENVLFCFTFKHNLIFKLSKRLLNIFSEI